MKSQNGSFCIGAAKYAPWTDDLMKAVFGRTNTKSAFVDSYRLSESDDAKLIKLETCYWPVRMIAQSVR